MTNITHIHQCTLAKRWVISPKTLERWRWQGIGPKYLKIGGRVVYRLADIEEYEAKCLRDTLDDWADLPPEGDPSHPGFPICRGDPG